MAWQSHRAGAILLALISPYRKSKRHTAPHHRPHHTWGPKCSYVFLLWSLVSSQRPQLFWDRTSAEKRTASPFLFMATDGRMKKEQGGNCLKCKLCESALCSKIRYSVSHSNLFIYSNCMGERGQIHIQSQYDPTTPRPEIHSEWNSIWYLLEATMDAVRCWEQLLELPLCLLSEYRS